MKQLIFGLAALVALSACGSPPCTTCPDLAGPWHFEAKEVPATSSSCRHYFSSGFVFDLTFVQDGATMSEDSSGMTGTLHESGQINFNEVPFGHATDGAAVSVKLNGKFLPSGPQYGFKGSVYAIIHSNPTCTLTIPTTGTPE